MSHQVAKSSGDGQDSREDDASEVQGLVRDIDGLLTQIESLSSSSAPSRRGISAAAPDLKDSALWTSVSPQDRPRPRATHGYWLGIAMFALVAGIYLGFRVQSTRQESQAASPESLVSPSLGAELRRHGTVTAVTVPERDELDPSEILTAEAMRSRMSALMRSHGTDASQQERQFLELLEGLNADNAQGMWEVLKESEQDVQGSYRMALFAQRWGSLDGREALAATKESQRWRSLVAASALEGWSEKQPNAALAWAETQDGELGHTESVALLKGLLKADADLAIGQFEQLADPNHPSAFVAPVVAAQLRQGFSQAEAWASSLSNEALRASALEQLGRALAKDNLERAEDWAIDYATDSEGGRLLGAVADSLIANAFAKGGKDQQDRAIDWLDALPEGESKNIAYTEAIRAHARRDFNEAGAFLGRLPSSDAKDRAVRAFALEVSHRDPEAAVAWASIIADPDSRERTLFNTARQWYRRDQASSSEWLATAGLSDALLRRITQR